MVSFNDFLTQVIQPYFFYSIVFLSIAFVCIKISLKLNPNVSSRVQSLLWIIPLSIPLAVFVFYRPQSLILSSSPKTMVSVTAEQTIALFWNSSSSTLSLTGILCLTGVFAATTYFIVTIVFGQKLAMKRFHVVPMAPDENVELQERIREISCKIGIKIPKLALNEDLMPNAFTLGYGRNAVVVFTTGILQMLDIEELTAVASHELAHIKARDYIFRSMTYALNVLSFFNPLSYFATSQAQKERELLADEKGASLLSQPKLMAKVLAKLGDVLQQYPKPRFSDRVSASLFLVSPLAHRPEILSAHPQIAHRVHNINVVNSSRSQEPRHKTATLFLLAILVCSALVSGYGMIQTQQSLSHKRDVFVSREITGNQSIFQNLSQNGAFLSTNGSLFNLSSFSLPPEYGNFSGQDKVLINNSGQVIVTNEPGTIYLVK